MKIQFVDSIRFVSPTRILQIDLRCQARWKWKLLPPTPYVRITGQYHEHGRGWLESGEWRTPRM